MNTTEIKFIKELFLSNDESNVTIASALCEAYLDDNPENIAFKGFYLNHLSLWNRAGRLINYKYDVSGTKLPLPIKSKHFSGKRYNKQWKLK